jgi:copper chaperone CopZ
MERAMNEPNGECGKQRRATANANHLVAKAGEFCQIDSRLHNPKTKTAIISIANLKAEDITVLRQAFQALPGVEKIDFSVERSVAVIDFDPSQSHIDDFLRAVLKAGFQIL